jgi:lysozyme family protein
LANQLRFTAKARDELELDDLTVDDIRESLMNAVAIYKTLRSLNPYTRRREHLHIIQSPNLSGIAIYTKGKIVRDGSVESYYLLISSKRAL